MPSVVLTRFRGWMPVVDRCADRTADPTSPQRHRRPIAIVLLIADDLVGVAHNVADMAPHRGHPEEALWSLVTGTTHTTSTVTDNDAQSDLAVEEVSGDELDLPPAGIGLARTGSPADPIDLVTGFVLCIGGVGLLLLARRRGVRRP